MPETAQEYHARIAAAADDAGPVRRRRRRRLGRLPVRAGRAAGQAARAAGRHRGAPPRRGRPVSCAACTRRTSATRPRREVWRDEHWRVAVAEPTGVAPGADPAAAGPPRLHRPARRPGRRRWGASWCTSAPRVEALPSVARVHVSKWGDGGAHAHVFFFARPARMPQLRGTCMALWDDVLPPVPVEVRDANARAVVAGWCAVRRPRSASRPERPRPAARRLSARGPRNRRERLRRRSRGSVGAVRRCGDGLWSSERRPPDRLGGHVREWRIL